MIILKINKKVHDSKTFNSFIVSKTILETNKTKIIELLPKKDKNILQNELYIYFKKI